MDIDEEQQPAHERPSDSPSPPPEPSSHERDELESHDVGHSEDSPGKEESAVVADAPAEAAASPPPAAEKRRLSDPAGDEESRKVMRKESDQAVAVTASPDMSAAPPKKKLSHEIRDDPVAYESTLSMLRKWVENGQLGGNVAARCETILAQIRDEKLMKFNEVVAAAVLFIACRQESVPTTYKEVCALSNAPRKKVVHSQKQIVAALGLQDLEPFKAADSVARFCLNLNLPQPIQDAVCKISLRALDAGFVNAGKCPLSVAAAAVVMVCRCSDKEIVRVSNVSLTTVRNCIQMLEDHRAELLEGVDLPSEPFHFSNDLPTVYQKNFEKGDELDGSDGSENTSPVLGGEEAAKPLRRDSSGRNDDGHPSAAEDENDSRPPESGGKCDMDTKNYFPPRYFNLPQAGVTWDIPHKLVQKGALVVKLKPWHDAKSSFVPLNMSEYLGRALVVPDPVVHKAHLSPNPPLKKRGRKSKTAADAAASATPRGASAGALPEHGHVPAPRGRGSGGAQRGQATAAMKLASQGPRPPVGPGIGPEMGPGPYMPGRGPMGMPPGMMSGDPRRTSLAPGYMGQGASRSPKMENDDGPGPKGPYPPPHGPGPMGGHMPMEDWHRHHNYPSGPMGPPGDERRLGPGGHPMPSGNSPMLMQGQGPPGLRPMDSKPMPPRPMAPSGRMMPLPPQHPGGRPDRAPGPPGPPGGSYFEDRPGMPPGMQVPAGGDRRGMMPSGPPGPYYEHAPRDKAGPPFHASKPGGPPPERPYQGGPPGQYPQEMDRKMEDDSRPAGWGPAPGGASGPAEFSRYPAPPPMSGMDKDRRESFQPPMGSYPRPPGPGYQGGYPGGPQPPEGYEPGPQQGRFVQHGYPGGYGAPASPRGGPEHGRPLPRSPPPPQGNFPPGGMPGHSAHGQPGGMPSSHFRGGPAPPNMPPEYRRVNGPPGSAPMGQPRQYM